MKTKLVVYAVGVLTVVGSAHAMPNGAPPQTNILDVLKCKACKIEQKACDIDTGADACDNKIELDPAVLTDRPIVIDQSGSYILCDDLTSTVDGIRIEVDDVVLDLNGFSIIGDNVGINDAGIVIAANNAEVFNGTIRDFVDEGDGLGFGVKGSGASNFLHNLSIHSNDQGIELTGNTGGNVIKDCFVHDNGSAGIRLFSPNNCLLSVVSKNNGSDGVIIGLASGTGNVIADCVINDNTSFGILIQSSDNLVRNCVINHNVDVASGIADGIAIFSLHTNNTIEDCIVSYNGKGTAGGSGISIRNGATDNHVSNNVCDFNGVNTDDYGIKNEGGATNQIWANYAQGNAGTGGVGLGNNYLGVPANLVESAAAGLGSIVNIEP